MKPLHHLFLFLLCLCHGALGNTQQSMQQKLLHEFTAHQQWQAQFTHNIYQKDAQLIQSNKGYLYLKLRHGLRWEIKQPNQQIILIHNHLITSIDPELQQVRIEKYRLRSNNNPLIALLLQPEKKLLNQWIIQRTVQKNETYYQLKAKNKHDQLFHSLTLIFSSQHMLKKIIFFDTLDQKSIINFFYIQKNIPSNIWNYPIPKTWDKIIEKKMHR